MQLQCSVLKHQNSYEFIHDHKNSNNIPRVHGSIPDKMASQSTRASTYEKKLLKTKVQVGSKEICNITIKDRVVAV